MSGFGQHHSAASSTPFSSAGQDVAAAHGHGRDADVLVDLAGDAGRRAEAQFAEVGHVVDRLLEPAERLGPDRLQDEALHVDLHLLPELVVELLAAAVQEPRDPGQVVHAARPSRRRASRTARRRDACRTSSASRRSRPRSGPCRRHRACRSRRRSRPPAAPRRCTVLLVSAATSAAKSLSIVTSSAVVGITD